MKNIYYLLLALTLLVLPACKKDEVTPLTGDLKLVLLGTAPNGISYALYTEGSRSTSTSAPPLTQGQFIGNTIFIRDLNHGNYLILVGNNVRSIQVTAGREREYKFPI